MKRGLEAKCPFWIDRHDRHGGVIFCEGVVKGCGLQLNFRRSEDASRYKKRYCASDAYHECRIQKAVGMKYE